jgi:hypothetical protein
MPASVSTLPLTRIEFSADVLVQPQRQCHIHDFLHVQQTYGCGTMGDIRMAVRVLAEHNIIKLETLTGNQ